MGNSVPHGLSDDTGKVILSDGAIYRYDKPLTVAELMLEHPQQVVVEFEPVMNGKRPTPLPADEKLEKNKVYLMLLIRRGKPALFTAEDARRLLMKSNSILKSKSVLSYYTGFVPFFVRVCPATASIEGRNDVILPDKKMGLLEGPKPDYFSEILEGRPEFLSRQISGKGWKPSLDTIKEKTIKAQVRHWLF